MNFFFSVVVFESEPERREIHKTIPESEQREDFLRQILEFEQRNIKAENTK